MSGYGYLTNGNPAECFGCEACVQACTQKAIRMQEDREGFRYPYVDLASCNTCGVCHSVCPWENPPTREPAPQYAFGGYHTDPAIRQASTSGGAFSALVSAWCEEDSVVFGAVADGLEVSHQCTSGRDTERFRKSKYV